MGTLEKVSVQNFKSQGGVDGIMVNIADNGLSKLSSNPNRGCLLMFFGKG